MTLAELHDAAVAAVGYDGLDRLRAAGLLVAEAGVYQEVLKTLARRTLEVNVLRGQLAARRTHVDYSAPMPERMVELVLRQGPPA